MRLVVTIPAYNEERTLGKVIREIPRKIDKIDEVKVVVIDDGSIDDTRKVAFRAGADKVISFKQNRGLAQAFKMGLNVALQMNSDIIVNIDADGQYDGAEISKLINPILNSEADIVLGFRFKEWIEDMSLQKKVGNYLATKVTNLLSGLKISDAQTGFRAFSKEAALKINVISNYTYVQETIMQAVNKQLKIVEVPVHFRRRKGKSRLISNIFSYSMRAGITIVKTYRDYKPLRTFLLIGGFFIIIGLVFGLRVLIQYLNTSMITPYIPSVVLIAILLIVGFQVVTLALIADMIGNNRKVQEEILYILKKRNLEK